MKSLLWIAFQAGALRGVILRTSRHSSTGIAAVFYFASYPAAIKFARHASRRVAYPCKLRPATGHSGRLWSVSAPVVGAVPFVSVVVSVAGGVRALPKVAHQLEAALL